MTAPSLPSLVFTLLTLCDDAFFAVASTARLDLDVLRALSKRRSAALIAVARGAPPEEISQGDPWLIRLAAAIAPIAPPRWLPMANLIEDGLSLEHGARGMRALFTSKPSEKEIARVRSLGAFSVRALASVLSGSGNLRPEAHLYRSCLVASLGLSDEEQRALLAEEPLSAESIDVPASVEPKLARGILRGAFMAAMLEGDDPRDEQAVLVLGRKTGLPAEDVTAAHGEARRAIDAAKSFGAACVDAVRYVLDDHRDESARLAAATARLTLPAPARREAIESATAGGAVTLARRHVLDRRAREAVLGLAWAAALRSNPTYTRRAELSLRHDRVASDLGEDGAGAEARKVIEGFLDEELLAAIPLAPQPLM